MRKFLFFLMTVFVQLSFAQDKSQLIGKDREIRSLLGADLDTRAVGDSIAVYSLYIRVTPQANKTNQVYVSSPLARKLFPNLDTVLANVDFNVFLKGTKQKHVMIPVGILVAAHDRMPSNSSFNVYELTKANPIMTAEGDAERYSSVFLTSYFVVVDKKSSH